MKTDIFRIVFIVMLVVVTLFMITFDRSTTNTRISELYEENSDLNFDNAVLRSESSERLETIRNLEAQLQAYEDSATDTCYIERLGTFDISYYAPGDEGVDDITATGTTVAAGRTVAVDPSVIPYGSEIYIEGIGWRIAEDTGGAIVGMKLDIYVDSREEAIRRGRHGASVYIKRVGWFELPDVSVVLPGETITVLPDGQIPDVSVVLPNETIEEVEE